MSAARKSIATIDAERIDVNDSSPALASRAFLLSRGVPLRFAGHREFEVFLPRHQDIIELAAAITRLLDIADRADAAIGDAGFGDLGQV